MKKGQGVYQMRHHQVSQQGAHRCKTRLQEQSFVGLHQGFPHEINHLEGKEKRPGAQEHKAKVEETPDHLACKWLLQGMSGHQHTSLDTHTLGRNVYMLCLDTSTCVLRPPPARRYVWSFSRLDSARACTQGTQEEGTTREATAQPSEVSCPEITMPYVINFPNSRLRELLFPREYGPMTATDDFVSIISTACTWPT
jgi:hypothetical protein